MGKIVAIGGGEMRNGETNSIDNYIIRLSGKENPKLLFIPTASHDDKGYIDNIKLYFGMKSCTVDALCLYSDSYSQNKIRDMILDTDIIYVGGGDTVEMMKVWKQYHVDEYLKEAYEKNIVLSGISAGSICWFEFGHSDSNSFNNVGWWDFTRAYGLGLIKAAHCPHYNEKGRESFDEMLKDETICGIALENGSAFVDENGKYHVIKENINSKAYKITYEKGIKTKKEMDTTKYYTL
ncbi:peptidase E [Sedimentibacter sp. zth1]|uniref:Type 1 glutamine amidotransferase-like domain-containing protein n=1 Tax=Sedimentibacter sp. zth1 TaxID=2816908 RepID=UPI001A9395C4|nr:peptidase E [Sedimentibacter sp. zth1]QSX06631.1 peptidase E [Sedimentibacter sp. zth1]